MYDEGMNLGDHRTTRVKGFIAFVTNICHACKHTKLNLRPIANYKVNWVIFFHSFKIQLTAIVMSIRWINCWNCQRTVPSISFDVCVFKFLNCYVTLSTDISLSLILPVFALPMHLLLLVQA